MNAISANRTPEVSIIMPNFNGARWVGEAIESVIDQTYQNWQLIVVDDRSADDSVAVIKDFSSRDDRISLRILPENSGSASLPRNAALEAVRGRYIAFLDADDLWYPSKLEKQISLMSASDPETALCYHDMEISTIGNKHPTTTYYSQAHMRRPAMGKCFKTLLVRNFIANSSVMLRRDAITRLQYFQDTTLKISNDWDLWLRIAWLYKFRYLPDVLGTYRTHDSNISSHKSLMKQEVRRIIRKWRGKASPGAYAKAMATRRLFEIYDVLPGPIKGTLRSFCGVDR